MQLRCVFMVIHIDLLFLLGFFCGICGEILHQMEFVLGRNVLCLAKMSVDPLNVETKVNQIGTYRTFQLQTERFQTRTHLMYHVCSSCRQIPIVRDLVGNHGYCLDTLVTRIEGGWE